MSEVNPVSLKSKLLLVAAVLIAILIPLQFWRSVWFGQELTDEQIEEVLEEKASSRRIQHVLTQLEERLSQDDPSVEKWLPKIAELARHPRLEIRLQVAWVMGQKNDYRLFRETLSKMLADPEPLVKRNAALGLTRFADERALPVLRSMLQPFEVSSPLAGSVVFFVREGERTARGTELARIGTAPEVVESPLPGRVLTLIKRAGETVEAGESLLSLAPDPEHVWEALRALYLLGGEQDLSLVETYIDHPGYSQELRQQARNTAQAIRERLGSQG